MFIDCKGNFKLSNFSASRLVTVEGSQYYGQRPANAFKAPECFYSKHPILTKKSDIWGLGTVIYNFCTIVQRAKKQIPYESTTIELPFASSYSPLSFPIKANYSFELKNLVEKMLHKDYKKRPTASEILDRVKDWPRAESGFDLAKKNYIDFGKKFSIEERTGNLVRKKNKVLEFLKKQVTK